MNRDFQIHTSTTDGEATVPEILERAIELGLREIAFTEHVRRTSDYFSGFARDVRRARRRKGVCVYVGIETKAQDEYGTLDASPEVLAECEIVLGSVHRFPIGECQLADASAFDYEEAARRELSLAMGMLKNAPIDVLSHPGGMCQRAFGKFPDESFEELMLASLDRGIAIEINSKYTRDLDSFLELCRRANPFVSIGSDVHKLSDLGTCRNALWARGIGCP